MEILIIIIGFLLLILGLVGCFLPVIPGPPLSFAAILLLHFTGYANDGEGYSPSILIVLGILAIGILIIDMLIPIYGAKRTGSTRAGIVGSSIGIIAGLIFAGATGGISIIAGPFIGAVVGEMVSGRASKDALRAGIGTFLGFLAGTLSKVIVSVIITIFFVLGLF
ncbi:MAG: DUF456 domain-containing protein [Chitinophagales bacterium]|nr:DUF456 domain-containing protein [Chitinophagales bacterium]